MAVLYFAAGINHFIMPEFYMRMIPPYVPFAHAAVVMSGIAEIALAIFLCMPQYRRWAAWGIIFLLVAVFPANLYMALHYEKFSIPALAAYARLPLQLVLIGWAYVYTRKQTPL